MTCKAKTSSGLHCKACAQSGSEYCFFHDVGSSKERQASQSRGGRARKLSVALLPVEPFDVSDPTKISAMLTKAANLLRTGQLDAKRVHALGHLADCALKAYVLSTKKQQLDRIERLLEAQRNRPADPDEAEAMLRFVPEEEIEVAARRMLQAEAHDDADSAASLVDDFIPGPIEIDE